MKEISHNLEFHASYSCVEIRAFGVKICLWGTIPAMCGFEKEFYVLQIVANVLEGLQISEETIFICTAKVLLQSVQ